MSLGIYKQGQGYWVRVMTAAALGIAFIAAAAWGWGQAGIVRLPAREWTLSLSNVQGEIQPGESVVLMFYDVEGEDPEALVELGSAVVDEYNEGKSASGILKISSFQDSSDPEIAARVSFQERASDAERLFIGTLTDQTVSAIVKGGTPTPIFPILYLQVGVAGGIMLLGALTSYLFVGTKKNSVEFLIATDGEMKKVNWTSYKEVKGSTIVVIAATFLIAGFLFVVDIAFSNFFSWIQVLEK
jgi:preprotein translocase SecE subunit